MGINLLVAGEVDIGNTEFMEQQREAGINLLVAWELETDEHEPAGGWGVRNR